MFKKLMTMNKAHLGATAVIVVGGVTMYQHHGIGLILFLAFVVWLAVYWTRNR